MNQKVLKQILQIQKTSKVEVAFIVEGDQILKTFKGGKYGVNIPSRMVAKQSKKINKKVFIAHSHPFGCIDNYLPSCADIEHHSILYTNATTWDKLEDSFVVSEHGYFSLKTMTFYCWNMELFYFLKNKERIIDDFIGGMKYSYKVVFKVV